MAGSSFMLLEPQQKMPKDKRKWRKRIKFWKQTDKSVAVDAVSKESDSVSVKATIANSNNKEQPEELQRNSTNQDLSSSTEDEQESTQPSKANEVDSMKDDDINGGPTPTNSFVRNSSGNTKSYKSYQSGNTKSYKSYHSGNTKSYQSGNTKSFQSGTNKSYQQNFGLGDTNSIVRSISSGSSLKAEKSSSIFANLDFDEMFPKTTNTSSTNGGGVQAAESFMNMSLPSTTPKEGNLSSVNINTRKRAEPIIANVFATSSTTTEGTRSSGDVFDLDDNDDLSLSRREYYMMNIKKIQKNEKENGTTPCTSASASVGCYKPRGSQGFDSSFASSTIGSLSRPSTKERLEALHRALSTSFSTTTQISGEDDESRVDDIISVKTTSGKFSINICGGISGYLDCFAPTRHIYPRKKNPRVLLDDRDNESSTTTNESTTDDTSISESFAFTITSSEDETMFSHEDGTYFTLDVTANGSEKSFKFYEVPYFGRTYEQYQSTVDLYSDDNSVSTTSNISASEDNISEESDMDQSHIYMMITKRRKNVGVEVSLNEKNIDEVQDDVVVVETSSKSIPSEVSSTNSPKRHKNNEQQKKISTKGKNGEGHNHTKPSTTKKIEPPGEQGKGGSTRKNGEGHHQHKKSSTKIEPPGEYTSEKKQGSKKKKHSSSTDKKHHHGQQQQEEQNVVKGLQLTEQQKMELRSNSGNLFSDKPGWLTDAIQEKWIHTVMKEIKEKQSSTNKKHHSSSTIPKSRHHHAVKNTK